jgi:hypothetical protein
MPVHPLSAAPSSACQQCPMHNILLINKPDSLVQIALYGVLLQYSHLSSENRSDPFQFKARSGRYVAHGWIKEHG